MHFTISCGVEQRRAPQARRRVEFGVGIRLRWLQAAPAATATRMCTCVHQIATVMLPRLLTQRPSAMSRAARWQASAGQVWHPHQVKIGMEVAAHVCQGCTGGEKGGKGVCGPGTQGRCPQPQCAGPPRQPAEPACRSAGAAHRWSNCGTAPSSTATARPASPPAVPRPAASAACAPRAAAPRPEAAGCSPAPQGPAGPCRTGWAEGASRQQAWAVRPSDSTAAACSRCPLRPRHGSTTRAGDPRPTPPQSVSAACGSGTPTVMHYCIAQQRQGGGGGLPACLHPGSPPARESRRRGGPGRQTGTLSAPLCAPAASQSAAYSSPACMTARWGGLAVAAVGGSRARGLQVLHQPGRLAMQQHCPHDLAESSRCCSVGSQGLQHIIALHAAAVPPAQQTGRQACRQQRPEPAVTRTVEHGLCRLAHTACNAAPSPDACSSRASPQCYARPTAHSARHLAP